MSDGLIAPMSFVAILGAGPVGAATAESLARRARISAVRIVDADAQVAAGKALDISQAGPITGATRACRRPRTRCQPRAPLSSSSPTRSRTGSGPATRVSRSSNNSCARARPRPSCSPGRRKRRSSKPARAISSCPPIASSDRPPQPLSERPAAWPAWNSACRPSS